MERKIPVITMAKVQCVTIVLLLTGATVWAETMVQSERTAPALPRPKQTHLRFYWHDILSGRNPTSVKVAEAPTTKTSATGFGLTRIFDNPLTLSPNLTSKVIGRSQGTYLSASKEEVGLSMTMSMVFSEGRFNGSSVVIVGRNEVMATVREMAVVGGSGVFRFATGYCHARTHTFDARTGDAVVLYDVYVRHYY